MKKIDETGRTMLEVISVLVIMMVLLIGGLTGYDYLIQYRNRQETAKIATSALMSVRSADLARKAKPDVLLTAEEVIPSAEKDGDFFVLPDSPESLAVVRSMKEGAFAMALKVEPGTCDTILESLSQASVSAFVPSEAGFKSAKTGTDWKGASKNVLTELEGDNGVNLNYKKELDEAVKYYEDHKGVKTYEVNGKTIKSSTAKRWKTITEECSKDGHLMIVSGCTPGSSADNNYTGFICPGCEAGQVQGLDKCCDVELCGGYCDCPEGKVRFGSGADCRCVDCDPTKSDKDIDTCKGKYNRYSKHVCYEVKGVPACVECREDADCQTRPVDRYKGYSDASSYEKFNDVTMYCVENICLECNRDYDSSKKYVNDNTVFNDKVGHAYCPKNRPMCNDGLCVECTGAHMVYDEVKGQCFCEGGYETIKKDGQTICVTCQDDKTGATVDTGCGSAKPICYPETTKNIGNDAMFGAGNSKEYWVSPTAIPNNATRLKDRRCVECTEDSHCKEGEYCDSYTSEASAKSTKRSYSYDYTCKPEPAVCRDTETGAGTDQDCGIAPDKKYKLCVPKDDKTRNAGDNAEGERCLECFGEGVNCPSNSPICRHIEGLYGECEVCQATEFLNASSTKTDRGCPGAKPVCKADKEDEYGDRCYVCQNNQPNDTKDRGCEPGTPLCPATDGNYTDSACKYCQNNHEDATQDLGCKESGKPLCKAAKDAFGDSCYKCQDTKDGAGTDLGCESGDNHLCGDNSGSIDWSKATNNYYNTCYRCLNNRTASEQVAGSDGKIPADMGCDSDKPFCNGESNKYGTECTEAQRCPEGMILNPVKNECAYCYDSKGGVDKDEGCSPDYPICNVVNGQGVVQNTGGNMSNKTNTGDNKCYKCIDDKTNQRDSGCKEADKPICAISTSSGQYVSDQASGNFSRTCVHCLDNHRKTDTDLGCKTSEKEHICVPADNGQTPQENGAAANFRNHASGFVGTQCLECLLHSNCKSKGSEWYCDNYKVSRQNPTWTCRKCPKGVWSDSLKACCDGCVDRNTEQCIKLTDYDDLEKDSDGYCRCIASVRSDYVNDQANTYNGSKDLEKGYHCLRIQTHRQRVYQIPVKFYCPRYMHVSDDASADDFVADSYPAGIGTSSPAVVDRSWRHAHDNSISPRVSTDPIPKGNRTAKLVVEDRWAEEVGFKGYFYFTVEKNDRTPPSGNNLRMSYGWKSGHSQSSPVGDYVCKVGEGSSTLPSKYHKHCSEYCD